MIRAAIISTLLINSAIAETWTVDDDGKADFNNIQAAVNAASDGDEIIVGPGTYSVSWGPVVHVENKSLWIHSSHGYGATTIDGQGNNQCMFLQNHVLQD